MPAQYEIEILKQGIQIRDALIQTQNEEITLLKEYIKLQSDMLNAIKICVAPKEPPINS